MDVRESNAAVISETYTNNALKSTGYSFFWYAFSKATCIYTDGTLILPVNNINLFTVNWDCYEKP